MTRRARSEPAAQAAARRRRRLPTEPRGLVVETFRRLVADPLGLASSIARAEMLEREQRTVERGR